MGGHVPFGYEAVKRQLLSKECEARQVRRIYRLYLELRTVKAVKSKIEEYGIQIEGNRHTGQELIITSEEQGFKTDEEPNSAGTIFSRGYLYRILTNPLYMGMISHKGILSAGLHAAIIPAKQWQAAQEKLKEGAARERDQSSAIEPSPLAGILYDHRDKRITPSHAVKAGKRYRYYVSNCLIENPATASGIRISAPEVEGAVCTILHDLLANEKRLSELVAVSNLNPSELQVYFKDTDKFATQLKRQAPHAQLMKLRPAIARMIIGLEDIKVTFDATELASLITNKPAKTAKSLNDTLNSHFEIKVPMRIGRRGQETRLILQSVKQQQRPIDQALLILIAKGYVWRNEIVSGKVPSILKIAHREKVAKSYIGRLIETSFLAPDIVTAIANGTAPSDLNIAKLRNLKTIPLDWPSQRAVLGF